MFAGCACHVVTPTILLNADGALRAALDLDKGGSRRVKNQRFTRRERSSTQPRARDLTVGQDVEQSFAIPEINAHTVRLVGTRAARRSNDPARRAERDVALGLVELSYDVIATGVPSGEVTPHRHVGRYIAVIGPLVLAYEAHDGLKA